MEIINHIIITRCRFTDKKLMDKYLKISKDMLIPSLKSQINKNFKWGLFINEEDIDYVKEYLEYDFIPFNDGVKFKEFVKNNKFNIQTRHDIDDLMSPEYVDIIQKKYMEYINKWDSFLIQSQPIRLDLNTNKEIKLKKYTNTNTSMHLSLCQKDIIYSVHQRSHNKIYKLVPNVVSLPEGYTKWVIHGENLSIKRKLIKYGKNK